MLPLWRNIVAVKVLLDKRMVVVRADLGRPYRLSHSKLRVKVRSLVKPTKPYRQKHEPERAVALYEHHP